MYKIQCHVSVREMSFLYYRKLCKPECKGVLFQIRLADVDVTRCLECCTFSVPVKHHRHINMLIIIIIFIMQLVRQLQLVSWKINKILSVFNWTTEQFSQPLIDVSKILTCRNMPTYFLEIWVTRPYPERFEQTVRTAGKICWHLLTFFAIICCNHPPSQILFQLLVNWLLIQYLGPSWTAQS